MQDTTAIILEQSSGISSDLWFWIAIIEFIIILLLLFVKKGNDSRNEKFSKFKKEALKEEVDFRNILDSSFNAPKLYDELKKQCHPDRYVDDAIKNKAATELSLEIAKNKDNIKRLKELKEEAAIKLGIK